MQERMLFIAGLVAGCVAGFGCTSPDRSGGVVRPVERPAVAGAGEAAAVAARERTPCAALAKPGFRAYLEDGRIWVFREGSASLAAFLDSGEPAKSVTLIGQGPAGATLRAVDRETAVDYLVRRDGFVTIVHDGRLWVFRPESEALAQFEAAGEPAKQVTLVGAGPLGLTVKGPDKALLQEYLCARPGFEVFVRDGRLWVFRPGSEALAAFREAGEPARHVTIPGEGPYGLTVKAPARELVLEYLASPEGFAAFARDDRIWVFRVWDEQLAGFAAGDEPAKNVSRIGAGPLGRTLRATDRETLDALQAVLGAGR